MTPLWMLCHVDCRYGEDSDEHDRRCEPQSDLHNANLKFLAKLAENVRPDHPSVGGITPQYVEVEVPAPSGRFLGPRGVGRFLGHDEPREPDV